MKPALGGRRLRIRGRIIILSGGGCGGEGAKNSANGYGLSSRRSEKEDLVIQSSSVAAGGGERRWRCGGGGAKGWWRRSAVMK